MPGLNKQNSFQYSLAGIPGAFYKGFEKNYDTAERIEINSPVSLKGLIKECLLFFQRHLSGEELSENMQHKRIWDIPVEMLREALLNAVTHRDYMSMATTENFLSKNLFLFPYSQSLLSDT